MQYEKKNGHTFITDIFFGTFIGLIVMLLIVSFLFFDINKRYSRLVDSNIDVIKLISQKNETIRNQNEVIENLEQQIIELENKAK